MTYSYSSSNLFILARYRLMDLCGSDTYFVFMKRTLHVVIALELTCQKAGGREI